MKELNEIQKTFIENYWVEICNSILLSPNLRKLTQDIESLEVLSDIKKYNLSLNMEVLVDHLLKVNGASNDKLVSSIITPTNQIEAAVIEYTFDGIITLLEDGTIASFNLSSEKIFGFSKHEAIGKDVNILMPEKYRANHGKYLDSFLHSSKYPIQGIVREVKGQRKNLEIFDLEITVNKLNVHSERINNGNLLVGILRDISAKKQQEREKALDELKIEASNSALVNFITITSKDVQEPMRKIRSLCELLQAKSGPDDDRKKEYLHKIMSHTHRLDDFANALLKYSQIFKINDCTEKVSLNDLISNTADHFEIYFDKTGALLNVEPLPIIAGNKVKLHHLFYNLIHNSFQFRSPSTQPKISITYQDTNENHIICYNDNGIGISEEQLPKIFQPFNRDSINLQNNGMGLAICKKIMTDLGGRISCISAEGEGTAFFLTFPKTS